MQACGRRGTPCSDIHPSSPAKGERPDPSDIPPGCRFHPRCPVAFERCGWIAEEVVTELKDLSVGTPEEGLFAGLRADAPGAFTLPSAPPEAEATIRRLIEAKGEEFRGLKAIQSIERADGGIRLSLHEFSEPELKAIAPDVKVSCHLFA